MRSKWPAIALAAAFSAGLLLAPGNAFAQDEQQQSEQKKKEQEAKKDEQKKKEQQTQETVGTMLQKAQQPQQTPPPKPQQTPPPKPQPQPVPQQPQWQPRSHDDLPQLDREPRRLPPQRQRDLITEQRRRRNDYDIQLQNQQAQLERRSMDLRRQHRDAQYRYHQDYLDHLREQRMRMGRHHDFDGDPFFTMAPSYRYRRSGRWYDVNRYAATLLQDAVRYGYEEGFRAGVADREDGWHYECETSFVYLDANYGFEGLYVSSDDYHYYFRQGFRRGYEDGYYDRHRYGIERDGSVRIMTDVLRLIIDVQLLR